MATVCDQGTNNRQAIKLLINETRGVYLRRGETAKENIILINNQEIVPLYDPPHLLKCMRNNLITKNLNYTIDGVTKTAKWSHLQMLAKENPGYKGIRLIPKLTDDHINPEKINKMKVKYAAQIFSRTVASNMGYLAGNIYVFYFTLYSVYYFYSVKCRKINPNNFLRRQARLLFFKCPIV